MPTEKITKKCLYCGELIEYHEDGWFHSRKRDWSTTGDNGYMCFPNEDSPYDSPFSAQPNSLADRFLVELGWSAIRGDGLTHVRENYRTGKSIPESVFQQIVKELDKWFDTFNLSPEEVRELMVQIKIEKKAYDTQAMAESKTKVQKLC